MKQLHDGQWESPVSRGYIVECCDCGLLHRMNFRIVKKKGGPEIQFQAFRLPKKKMKLKEPTEPEAMTYLGDWGIV